MARIQLFKVATFALLAAVLLAPWVSEAAHAGDPVPVTSENLTLLLGTWEGHGESVSKSDGKTYWESDVTLTVENTAEGTFTLHQKGKSWQTAVRAKDGKVLLTYGRAERAFTLEQEGDGGYQLTIRYDSTYQGWKRDNTLVLTKR